GDNVALVYADAELDALVGCRRGIALTYCRLHLCRTAQRVDRTAEFYEQAVAGRLDDPAIMPLDGRIDQLCPDRLQPLQCTRLIGANQPRIADHIGGENGGETAGGGHLLACGSGHVLACGSCLTPRYHK